ncbi:MAG: STAS domain-containing protein [Planctomycetota bacterium]|nr:STAS domain-containing protein [Planctomycetota bacterium]
MTTQSHPIPAWLMERVDGPQLYLVPTVETLNEPEGRELTEYIRHRLSDDQEASDISAIVLDLSKVGLITSPAIGALIVIHKRMMSTNKQFILHNLSSMLLEALCFLKLDHVLTICRTDQELDKALSSR